MCPGPCVPGRLLPVIYNGQASGAAQPAACPRAFGHRYPFHGGDTEWYPTF